MIAETIPADERAKDVKALDLDKDDLPDESSRC